MTPTIALSPRVCFVADPHVGNHKRLARPGPAGVNSRARFALDALSVAASRAKGWSCPLVILGDLFDRTNTDPRLIAATMEAIAPAPEVFVLLGNHDAASAAVGDNALAPLRFMGGVGVVDEPRVVRLPKPGAHIELLMVPWRPGPAAEWLPEAVYQLHDHAQKMRKHSMEAPTRLLCLHLGIEDDRTPPFLRGAEDSIPARVVGELLTKYGIRAALAGNWHDRRRWDITGPGGAPHSVLQVGTLCPTGWNNPGLDGYGGLAWWDGEELGCDTIGGPRFLDARTAEEFTEATALGAKGLPVFVRWWVAAEDVASAREAIDEAMEEGTLAGGEAVVDPAEVVASARSAATAARTSTSLTESLTRYVEAMELPAEVERPEVLTMARRYMGLGGGA